MARVIPPLGPPDVEWRLAQLSATRPEAAEEAAARRDAWECPRVFTPSHNFVVRPWQGWAASSARRVLSDRSTLRRRADLLAAAARGEGPPAPVDGREAEATELIQLFAREHPLGLAGLVDRMVDYIGQDGDEFDKVSQRVASQFEHYATGGDLALLDYARTLIERQLVLEPRISRRQRALESFRGSFPKHVLAAVGDRKGSLASGLAESLSLSGGLPPAPPDLVAAEVELAGVAAELERLVPVSGVPPGPIATDLHARKADLNTALKDSRARHSRTIAGAVKAPIEAALAGDVAAWQHIAGAIESHRAAFGDDLANAWLMAPIGAMIVPDPVTWAEVLLGCVQGGCYRESAW